MTLTEIITSNENCMDELEEFSNLPSEDKGRIAQLYNEINDILERLSDDYGDERNEDEDEDD